MAGFDVFLVVIVVGAAAGFLLRRFTARPNKQEPPAVEPQLKGALGRTMSKRQK